jgi:hypothetical protein
MVDVGDLALSICDCRLSIEKPVVFFNLRLLAHAYFFCDFRFRAVFLSRPHPSSVALNHQSPIVNYQSLCSSSAASFAK